MSDTPEGINATGKPFRVIIADDKPAEVTKIQSILEGESYEIPATFSNGRELVSWVKANGDGADAVVLDIVMPVLDGFAAFYEMRELPRMPRVIFYSVENSAAIVRKLVEDGAGDFVVKPIKEENLLAALRKVLHGVAAK
jgi:CheY-like chemotaxis protein